MFFQQLHAAFDAYLVAWRMLSKHRLWPMLLLSGCIYLCIILLGAYGVFKGMHWLNDLIFETRFVKAWSNYTALKILFRILIAGIYLASFFVFFSVYKYVLLILASPLYAYISEKTESLLTGATFQFNVSQFIKDIMRGVQLSIRNFIKQMSISILLLLLSFIPVVGLISALLFIVLDSYYYGFSMLDYSCERHQLNSTQSIAFVKKNKGLAIGNGLVFYCLFLIPVLGIIIGAPLSAMAAAISMASLKNNLR
jgi:CysZ protein